jgi:hypothetical protein
MNNWQELRKKFNIQQENDKLIFKQKFIKASYLSLFIVSIFGVIMIYIGYYFIDKDLGLFLLLTLLGTFFVICAYIHNLLEKHIDLTILIYKEDNEINLKIQQKLFNRIKQKWLKKSDINFFLVLFDTSAYYADFTILAIDTQYRVHYILKWLKESEVYEFTKILHYYFEKPVYKLILGTHVSLIPIEYKIYYLHKFDLKFLKYCEILYKN